jgi:electron transport complex protein RnfE
MLGLCATLACSTSATDAFGMGIAFSFVMICSNVVVSLVRRITPNQIRIPVFITVISTFVTVVDYAMKAYTPLLSRSLSVRPPDRGELHRDGPRRGLRQPQRVANPSWTGWAWASASPDHHPAGVIRELFGNGTIFGLHVLPGGTSRS